MVLTNFDVSGAKKKLNNFIQTRRVNPRASRSLTSILNIEFQIYNFLRNYERRWKISRTKFQRRPLMSNDAVWFIKIIHYSSIHINLPAAVFMLCIPEQYSLLHFRGSIHVKRSSGSINAIHSSSSTTHFLQLLPAAAVIMQFFPAAAVIMQFLPITVFMQFFSATVLFFDIRMFFSWRFENYET